MEQDWWKQVPPLILDREGRWYDQGVRVTSPRLAEVLLTHLIKDEEGRYVVMVGREKRYVEVEDAPYRALGIEVAGSEESSERLFVRLNNGDLESFDPATFWIAGDGTPYCRVKDSLHKVRFTVEAYRQLSAFIIEEIGADRYVLRIGSRRISVPVENG